MLFNFKPIGIVHSPFKKKEDISKKRSADPQGFSGVRGEIEIFPDFIPGLSDVSGFSHLIVIFVFHRSHGKKLFAHPPLGDKKRGVFATRSPIRPNPLGMTIVRLHQITSGILTVSGIDMIEGTPVLDIKPYTTRDIKTDIRIGWLAK
jgi:tRNA-Thr(GGU) m(6)t(6)A37 methyltransferase TsaA